MDQHSRDDQRRDLLFPPWVINGSSRYDELDDESKAVWRATRDQQVDPAIIAEWAHSIADATKSGLITPTEASLALGRIRKHDG